MSSRMKVDGKSFAADLSRGRTRPLVRVIAWYDNEIAYATRPVELVAYLTGHATERLDACRQQERVAG